jgi:transmembrane 9 superfamily member 2/4
LPAATSKTLQDADGKLKTVYEPGFSLGVKNGKEIGGEEGKFYVNNHAFITIKYHTNEANYDGIRIVGFEVSPDRLVCGWGVVGVQLWNHALPCTRRTR